MKKTWLTLAGVFAVVFAASAQDFPKNIFGIRAGLNVANVSIKDQSTDSRTSFHVGVSDQILLTRSVPFYLETGLYLSEKGAKQKETVEGYTVTAKMNPLYLEIPALLSYHIQLGGGKATIQPSFGLYYGLGLGGKFKYEETYDGETSKESYHLFKKETVDYGDGETEEIPQTLKRSDFGLRFGVGLTYRKVYLGVGYDLGLSNIAKDQDQYAEFKNKCFTLSVGNNF